MVPLSSSNSISEVRVTFTGSHNLTVPSPDVPAVLTIGARVNFDHIPVQRDPSLVPLGAHAGSLRPTGTAASPPASNKMLSSAGAEM